MSASIASLIVLLLSQFLPYIGVQIAPENLTTTVQVIVAIVTGIVIWVQHLKLKTQASGTRVNMFGGLKKN